MFKKLVVGAVLCGWAFPAFAQVAGIDGPGESPSDSETASPPIDFEIQLAPLLAGDEPFTLGDSVSDYSSTTARLTIKLPVGEGMELRLRGGLTVQTDLDDNSNDEGGSAFFGGARFNWTRGLRRFSPFASYEFERGFDVGLPDLVAVERYLDHKLAAGVVFQTNSWVCARNVPRRVACPEETIAVRVQASVERRYSDVQDRERLTPELKIEAEINFLAGITLTTYLDGQYRRFDEINGDRRIDWRGVAFAGFNFARAINRSFLREMTIGAQWVGVDSNVAGKSRSEWNVVPVLTFGIRF